MSTQESVARAFEPYVFQTRNVSEGENKAHTREGAQAMGFRGSIVGGAVVYGRMIRPLVSRYGETWLGRHWFSLRFKAPAYDDDLVTSHIVPDAHGDGPDPLRISATNEAGQELIEMRTYIPETLPPTDPLAALDPIDWEGERLRGTWERMEINKPFRRFRFCLALSQQLAYCDRTEEDLPIYRAGEKPPLHPGLIMAQGSMAVQNQFVMSFWIHAGSIMQTRELIRVGDAVEVRCIPIEKWKRGDNEWVKFYQVYCVNGQAAVEAWKTTIIKVAPRG